MMIITTTATTMVVVLLTPRLKLEGFKRISLGCPHEFVKKIINTIGDLSNALQCDKVDEYPGASYPLLQYGLRDLVDRFDYVVDVFLAQ